MEGSQVAKPFPLLDPPVRKVIYLVTPHQCVWASGGSLWRLRASLSFCDIVCGAQPLLEQSLLRLCW